MAKVDKSQYTKAQWRIVREQRRRQKELDRAQKAHKKLEKQKDTERTVKVAVNEPLAVQPQSMNAIFLLESRAYSMISRLQSFPCSSSLKALQHGGKDF